MTLDKILKILGKTKAAKVAGYGKSASWHWFQTGEKQKVPEMQALISWADHLKLNDAELGELVRDAHRTRERTRREESLDEMRVVSEEKERYLSDENEERVRMKRLSQYSVRLEQLRRKNGNNK
mgnify:CR=1 FL=1